ncbi:hypothetical protein DMN91_004061 [Ooceraea biroi]|uniref:Uncharacterized protein n=1 Tax=Ooceraea biroi TaxID=2015173 RepID=A0A3L8DUK3_OOCBI|nr:hypothetical protein DMN91_004061 [Ooceraea biroi]
MTVLHRRERRRCNNAATRTKAARKLASIGGGQRWRAFSPESATRELPDNRRSRLRCLLLRSQRVQSSRHHQRGKSHRGDPADGRRVGRASSVTVGPRAGPNPRRCTSLNPIAADFRQEFRGGTAIRSAPRRP